MKRMGLVALMALLCLPMGALAVREGVIEDAPMVEARRKTSYLPMHRVVVEETGWMLEEAYTEIDTREMSYDDIRANLTSNCRLTTGERKRMEKLMAAYAAGERTGDGASVLEAKKNVRVGVYALDPAEYDGERVLLLLPGNCLTDEEMLAILDAYRQLGEPFDPDALNERNCVRGHTFMGTSEGDNEERRARLKGLIQRGILRREDVPETLKATLEEMRDLEVKLQELRESKTTAPEDEKSAETPDSAAHAPDTTDVKVPLEDDDVPTIEMPDIPEKPERPMDAPSIHTDDETPAE